MICKFSVQLANLMTLIEQSHLAPVQLDFKSSSYLDNTRISLTQPPDFMHLFIFKF